MSNRLLLAGLLLGLAFSARAQKPVLPTTPPAMAPTAAPPATIPVFLPASKHKGELYFSWGYNRERYSRSDIRFRNTKTDNYDFVFHNAHASDKPDFKDFWRFNSLTIPQYNTKLGYFFNDKHDLGVEVSWDHLKYVVDDNQVMHVTGQIRGRAIDKDTLVTPSFVHLQHTNGNNYLMVSLVKRSQLWSRPGIRVSAISKVGGGALISYTISTVLGNHDPGYFHYHGWVAAASTGLRVDLLKYFFMQGDLQSAYVRYTNTKLGADHQGLATHYFASWQGIWSFGFSAPL